MRSIVWVLLFVATAAGAQERVSVTEAGQLRRADQEISQRDLFELAGRADLVAQSDARRSRRRWLVVGAAGSALALLVPGIIVYATAPNLSAPYCESSVTRYNDECLPQVRLHQDVGGAMMAAGVIGTVLFSSFAYLSSPDLLSIRELEPFVEAYNNGPPTTTLRLSPSLSPQLAGLVLSGTF